MSFLGGGREDREQWLVEQLKKLEIKVRRIEDEVLRNRKTGQGTGGVTSLTTSGVGGVLDHGLLFGRSDDDHTQYLLASGARPLTANWDAGGFEIRAATFESDIATGTAPLTVASTTVVTNLNSDLLDGQSGAYYLDSGNFTGTNWTDLTDTGATTLHKHDHGGQDGLTDDDHTQYVLLVGRSGGQIVRGGTAASNDLTLRSTSNATKGLVAVADEGGHVTFGGGAAASEVRLLEPSGGGTSYTGFVAPALAGNVIYTLPTTDAPVSGDVLSSNAAGVLSWITPVVTLALDDLSDVTVPTPASGDHLMYDGAGWVNMPPSSVTGTAQTLFLDEAVVSGDNHSLLLSPSGDAEEIDTVTVNANTGPAVWYIDRYMKESLGATQINGGLWKFNTYCKVDVTAGDTTIHIRINKRVIKTGMTGTFTGAGATRTFTVTGGTPFVAGDADASILVASLIETPNQTAWITAFTSTSVVTVTLSDPAYVNEAGVDLQAIFYLLFRVETDILNNTTVALVTTNIVQPAFPIGATDGLVAAYFAETTHNNNVVVSLYHMGAVNYSNIETPLVYSHDELEGLDSAATLYHHLTTTQYTDLTDGGATTLHTHAGGGYTDEEAQDAVGTILVDSASIDFTYTDATPAITATVVQAGIDHGSIGGLSDDDHSQYILVTGARKFTGDCVIDNEKEVRWEEATANGDHYAGLKAPASLAASYTLSLPTADGTTASSLLVSDAAGALSFLSAPYDISGFFAGVPGVSELLSRIVICRTVVLPINLTGSQGYCSVAATASTTFDIQVNGVSKGSMVFAAAGTVATFTFAAAVTMTAGDRVEIVAPNPADATCANVSYALKGYRTT